MTGDNIDRVCEGLKPFLTVEEVAELLQYHPATIGRWLETGYLRGSKLGKEWRIQREDLRDLLVANRNVVKQRGKSGNTPATHTKDNEGEA